MYSPKQFKMEKRTSGPLVSYAGIFAILAIVTIGPVSTGWCYVTASCGCISSGKMHVCEWRLDQDCTSICTIMFRTLQVSLTCIHSAERMWAGTHALRGNVEVCCEISFFGSSLGPRGRICTRAGDPVPLEFVYPEWTAPSETVPKL